MNTTTQEQIDYTPARQEFTQNIIERSGQPIFGCYACKRCAAGCPVAPETGGFTPDKLIRSILYGDKEAIFNNPLIWRCVSCFTCGTRCPNNIHCSKINEALKQIHKEENLHSSYPGVAYFHEEFFKSAIRSGRLNEIDFLLRYQVRYNLRLAKHGEFKKIGKELRKQIKFGNSLRKKKRLGLSLHSSKGRRELKKIKAHQIRKRKM